MAHNYVSSLTASMQSGHGAGPAAVTLSHLDWAASAKWGGAAAVTLSHRHWAASAKWGGGAARSTCKKGCLPNHCLLHVQSAAAAVGCQGGGKGSRSCAQGCEQRAPFAQKHSAQRTRLHTVCNHTLQTICILVGFGFAVYLSMLRFCAARSIKLRIWRITNMATTPEALGAIASDLHLPDIDPSEVCTLPYYCLLWIIVALVESRSCCQQQLKSRSPSFGILAAKTPRMLQLPAAQFKLPILVPWQCQSRWHVAPPCATDGCRRCLVTAAISRSTCLWQFPRPLHPPQSLLEIILFFCHQLKVNLAHVLPLRQL